MRALRLAGMAVARPDLPALGATGTREQEIRALLSQRMDAKARGVVGRAVEAPLAGGGTLDVLGWLRSVEETACRAGLLACGDVTVVAPALAGGRRFAERHVGGGADQDSAPLLGLATSLGAAPLVGRGGGAVRRRGVGTRSLRPVERVK
jgi:hypothetical protein